MVNGMNREDYEGLMAQACYEPLSTEEQAALDAFLAEDPEARKEFEELRAFAESLPSETPAFTGDLLPGLKREIEDLHIKPGTVPGPRSWFGWRPAAGVAAAAAVVVGLLQWQTPVSAPTVAENDRPVQHASLSPTAQTLQNVRGMLDQQDYTDAYQTISETLASDPSDKQAAGELQYLLANLEFGHFQQYDRAHEAYETLKQKYWDTAWQKDPQSATRLDILAEAAQDDYVPLHTIRRAVDRGDAGFQDLEMVLAKNAGEQSLVAALAVDAMRELAGGLETPGGAFEVAAYEKVLRRCTNPLAIAQLNHTLGEMYWKTIDDRAKAMDLFQQVANCDHPQLAGQACEQLDQLAAAQ
jgi:hypothetical protein